MVMVNMRRIVSAHPVFQTVCVKYIKMEKKGERGGRYKSITHDTKVGTKEKQALLWPTANIISTQISKRFNAKTWYNGILMHMIVV